jgi:hypothetical protein
MRYLTPLIGVAPHPSFSGSLSSSGSDTAIGTTAHELVLELGDAHRLEFLAEKTVKNYVSALFAKLGMERRTQAAAYAVRVFDDQHASRGERHLGPGD